jgi:hypothetical protein
VLCVNEPLLKAASPVNVSVFEFRLDVAALICGTRRETCSLAPVDVHKAELDKQLEAELLEVSLAQVVEFEAGHLRASLSATERGLSKRARADSLGSRGVTRPNVSARASFPGVTEAEHIFTVALVGPVYGYPDEPVFDGPTLEDHEPEVPYAKRIKLEVLATDATTLGEIIDRAASEIGTSSHFHDRVADALTGIAFYEPSDEDGLGEEPELRWQETIRVVNDSGEPSWAVRWVDLRVDELLASQEAGLVAGDPSRPYLWPLISQGGVLQQLSDSLWTLWLHWEHVLRCVWILRSREHNAAPDQERSKGS